MSIIYEQTPGGLYPTGQRTVSTFPSGLIRVDQSFACKTSAAATHRATLAVGASFPGDSYPAMDGLKIFPEPQEKRRDDGFTEFTVSAFGRMNGIGSVVDGLSTSSGTTVYLGSTSGPQIHAIITTKKTQSRRSVSNGSVDFDALNVPDYSPAVIANNLYDDTSTSVGYGAWVLKESSITNYGAFNELAVLFESF